MDLVQDGLFIGDLESASNLELLMHNDIGFIVNLGCEPVFITMPSFQYCSFPSILDSPEQRILDIFPRTNDFIKAALKAEKNVLVHCVYGQSRSASVIISFLMHNGHNFAQAIAILKASHPSISINPGFLCQLNLLSNKELYPVEILLTKFNGKNQNDCTPVSIQQHFQNRRRVEMFLCRKCKNFLGTDIDTLTTLCDHSNFLHNNCDDFWKGYVPQYKYIPGVETLPIPGYKIMRPLHWAITQIDEEKNEGIICCFSCKNDCGRWKKHGLFLCGGFILGFLFALDENKIISNIANKRKIDHYEDFIEDEDGNDRGNRWDVGW